MRGSLVHEKPLAQGPPGGVLGILGVVVVFGLIVGVMVTIYTVYKRGQKIRTETDNDLTEMPPVQKNAPPPPNKNSDMKGDLISDDIQVYKSL
ncbi:nectin-1 [Clarias magur]|uniref:Nectin-1 n=1 Tax=Clarias magur TaxID=1594786 RepID=A0A8J4V131_CLAMG|nr:nectin-1 [Clarias magur]